MGKWGVTGPGFFSYKFFTNILPAKMTNIWEKYYPREPVFFSKLFCSSGDLKFQKTCKKYLKKI